MTDLEQVRTELHGTLAEIELTEAWNKLRAFEELSEAAIGSLLKVERASDHDRARALRQLIVAAEGQLRHLHAGHAPDPA